MKSRRAVKAEEERSQGYRVYRYKCFSCRHASRHILDKNLARKMAISHAKTAQHKVRLFEDRLDIALETFDRHE